MVHRRAYEMAHVIRHSRNQFLKRQAEILLRYNPADD